MGIYQSIMGTNLQPALLIRSAYNLPISPIPIIPIDMDDLSLVGPAILDINLYHRLEVMASLNKLGESSVEKLMDEMIQTDWDSGCLK